MRKIIVLNRVSIDGYFASLNPETFGMDWFVQDPEVDKAVHKDASSDTLLLGATTFKGFERSWVPMLTNPDTSLEMKAVADELTNMKKVVFSKSATKTTWANTEFHSGNVAQVVKELRSQKGTNILVMGSGTIVQQLTNDGLIDEFVFIVSPVVAGRGKPLFKEVKQTGLTLSEVRSFKSGNVILRYGVGPLRVS
jgi:dihydrofolate reductase